MSTYFPAPWTPRGLHDTIGRVYGITPSGSASDSRFWWSTDPSFHADRDDVGRWEVTRSERGSSRVCARPDTDDDMVLWRMGHERAAWRRHAELPYLTAWNDERRRSRCAFGNTA